MKVDPRTVPPPPAPITAAEARAARLQEIDGCVVEIICSGCGRITLPPVKLMLRKISGQHRLGQIVDRIVCGQCRSRPAKVYLNETYYREPGTPAPGWSVQVWPVHLERHVEPGEIEPQRAELA